jgi:hypothetical protein
MATRLLTMMTISEILDEHSLRDLVSIATAVANFVDDIF